MTSRICFVINLTMKTPFLCMFLMFAYFSTSAFAGDIEGAVYRDLENTLSNDHSIAAFSIKNVSIIDMDRNAEYYLLAEWSQLTKDNRVEHCQAEIAASDYQRENVLITQLSKTCVTEL